jgi:hypothetical protein
VVLGAVGDVACAVADCVSWLCCCTKAVSVV